MSDQSGPKTDKNRFRLTNIFPPQTGCDVIIFGQYFTQTYLKKRK